jgi:hypothetical protein
VIHKKLGPKEYLRECNRRYGWSKAYAYRAMDPEQLQADRERSANYQKSRTSRQDRPYTAADRKADEEQAKRVEAAEEKARQEYANRAIERVEVPTPEVWEWAEKIITAGYEREPRSVGEEQGVPRSGRQNF